jgi:hypothetical protein
MAVGAMTCASCAYQDGLRIMLDQYMDIVKICGENVSR